VIRHLIRLAALASGPATPTRAYVGRLLDSAGDWVNRGDYYAWDPLAAIALVDSTVVRSTVMPITVELSGKFVRWTHRAAGPRHLLRWPALLVAATAACGAPAPVTVPVPPAAVAPLPAARPAISLPLAPVRVTHTSTLIHTAPTEVGMDAHLGSTLDSLATEGILHGAAPGMSIAVVRYGRLVHLRGYGVVDWGDGADAVTDSTLYDLASLTKVVSTTTAAMMLEEEGRLDLSRPVASYVPELSARDKSAITVRMLLTHSGGLEAYAPLYLKYRGRADFLAQINARPLKSAPGSQTVYSDWDMVLMQAVIERITGQSLDAFVNERVFSPLGMRDTRYLPDTSDHALLHRIAPTAVDSSRGGLLRGVVHDGNAWALGGVSGHAGLFSSARDLAVFMEMLLAGGEYAGVRIVKPQTVARWTARQSASSSRALGWDTPAPGSSAGRYFSPRSFGHTGFTGTSIWADPERGVFVILLMNRVNSRGEGEVPTNLRRDVTDAVQAAIHDAPLTDWEMVVPRRSP
jgi:CubicO group peptidase (beta-lactamase class C family)